MSALGREPVARMIAPGPGGPEAMGARMALWLGTRGGVACLSRDDLGALEPGRVRHLLVEGRPVVRDGRLANADEAAIAAAAHRAARGLVRAPIPSAASASTS